MFGSGYAELGIAQLRICDRFEEVRRGHATMYDERFRNISQVRVPRVKGGANILGDLQIIQLNLEQLRIGRNQMIEWLRKENIGTSVSWVPLYRHSYYRETSGYGSKDVPVKMTKTNVSEVEEIHNVTKIVRQYQG